MDNFIKIADKYYKLVGKIVGGVLALIILCIVGKTLSSFSQIGGGFYTFMYVIFWIVLILAILCLLYHLFRKYGATIASTATIPSAQPQHNSTYTAPASQVAGGEKFCTKCGAKVPAGNQFCNGCGEKMF